MSEDRRGRASAGVARLIGAGLLAGEGGIVARGAVGSLGVMVAATVFGFGNAVLLGRVLGPAGYGTYSLALSIVTTLFLVLFGGLSTLLVRETAMLVATGATADAKHLLRRSETITLVLAGALSLGLIGAALLGRAGWGTELSLTLMFAALLLPPAALVLVQAGALRGLGAVIGGLAPDLVLRPLLLMLLVSAVIFLSGAASLTPSRTMLLHVMACALALASSALWLRIAWGDAQPGMSGGGLEKTAFRTSLLSLTIVTGLQSLNANLDVLSLGALATEEDIGVYRVAAQLSLLVATAMSAMQVALQPRIAALHAGGRRDDLQALLTLSSRGMLLVVAPLALLCVMFGGPLIEKVFGVAYAAGAVPLAILAAGQILAAAAGATVHILNMTGNERDTIIGLGCTVVLNLLLNLGLIPRFGINGAAVAMSVSLIVLQAFLSLRIKQRTGLASSVLGR
jgi:O-antigen/teichoic acid export membrane protein